MSNFAFLPDMFSTIAESARRAEGYTTGDPRAEAGRVNQRQGAHLRPEKPLALSHFGLHSSHSGKHQQKDIQQHNALRL